MIPEGAIDDLLEYGHYKQAVELAISLGKEFVSTSFDNLLKKHDLDVLERVALVVWQESVDVYWRRYAEPEFRAVAFQSHGKKHNIFGYACLHDDHSLLSHIPDATAKSREEILLWNAWRSRVLLFLEIGTGSAFTQSIMPKVHIAMASTRTKVQTELISTMMVSCAPDPLA